MKKTLHLLRMAHGLMLVVVITVLLSAIPATAMADSEAYARLTGSTLTFYYNENKGQSTDATAVDYSLNTDANTPDWYDQREQVTKVVFNESFKDYRPTTCYMWFCGMTSLTAIENIYNLKTNLVTNMASMFSGCKSLATLDLSYFSTSNVKNMYCMFADCSALTELKLTSFYTEDVTNMAYMFSNCKSLTSVEMSYFITENVTDMNHMFSGCESLKELELSEFITSLVTNTSGMFANCKALTSLAITESNTSNVENMSEMFRACISLTALNLSGFKTGKVTDMSAMFIGCSALTSLDISNFDTGNVTDMSVMFGECYELSTIDLSSFNTAKVTNMDNMFYADEKLATITVSKSFTTAAVTSSDDMFKNCTSLQGAISYGDAMTDATYANYDTGYFTQYVGPYVRYADETLTFYYGSDKQAGDYSLSADGAYMYPGWYEQGDAGINKKVDPIKVVIDPSFSQVRPVSTALWFGSMMRLTSIEGMEYLNTTETTNMLGMFSACLQLTSIDLSHINTDKVTNMMGMFYGCMLLTDIDLSRFNTSQVTDMSIMFGECYKLSTIDLSGFVTDKVQDMDEMFMDCSGLTTLDLSNFNTPALTSTVRMFYECPSLKTIYVSDNFTTDKVELSYDMFYGCTSLNGAVAYNSNNVKVNYANYTDGYFTKKVGTNGTDILGATGSPLIIESLAIDDAKAYALNEGEDCQAATATYSRQMSSNWGTLCLPFAINAADEGNTCNFYSLKSVNTESITLTPIESGTIEAGTPVVISKKTASQASISVTATNAAVVAEPIDVNDDYTTDNVLAGTFYDVMVKGDCYYFIAKDKFFNASDYSDKGVRVNAFRGYILANDTGNRAAALSIVTDGSTTGIDATDTIDTLNNANAEYYDMSGRRIDGLQKGVNIIKIGNKTRKIIVK